MLRNYFTIAYRNLFKHKAFSLINICGLAVGMAVALLNGLWIWDELSFNTYHQNYNSIARVMKGASDNGKHYAGQMHLPLPLVNELKTNYHSHFKHIVTTVQPSDFILSVGEKKISKTGQFIEAGAPEMFTFKMIYGSWAGLQDPHSIMLSASTAKALFGNADPMNQVVVINNEMNVEVTGVYEDFPHNSQLHEVQFFSPWDLYTSQNPWLKEQGWDNHFVFAYAQMAPHTSFEKVQASIKDAEMKAIAHIPEWKEEVKYNPEVLLHPMRDWHLFSNFKEGAAEQGPIQFVWLVGIIGAFVLLLACINFMNLSTARSEKRAKEVGIRKAVGSLRGQLIKQFLGESLLVVWLSFVLSLLLVKISLPWFNDLAGKQMSILWENPWFWIASLTFILLTGLLSGSYPALYLSSFNPVKVLKGTFRTGRMAAVPRKILVVMQFAISVTLIICTIIVYHQIVFAKNRPVGYTREGLLMVSKKSDDFYGKTQILRSELIKTGVVTEMAESGGKVTELWSNNGGFDWKGKDPNFEAHFATLTVAPQYGKTVGWQFVAGRDFSEELATDSSGFVINETAAKYMGLENPVGEMVRWTNKWYGVDKTFIILGVIKDMVMGSPFEPIKPSIFFLQGNSGWINIKIKPTVSAGEALPKIEAVFKKIIPTAPFDYQFADDEYAKKFAAEERIGKLATFFATLAIFISCLGLFGLASFMAEQRTKEIGVRKVLGASIMDLWLLLSKDFVRLVLISFIVAVPIAWYAMNTWLENFAYRIAISWWIFALTGVGAMFIALFTVSWQSVKAALVNPVKSLRNE
jgi:ABC-type antimicrobial peptide transport system permease subunit